MEQPHVVPQNDEGTKLSRFIQNLHRIMDFDASKDSNPNRWSRSLAAENLVTSKYFTGHEKLQIHEKPETAMGG